MTPLLRQLNWLPVKQLLYYMDSVFTYKCFKGLAPKIWYINLLNAPASMLATPANVIYYIYSRLPITRTFKGNRKKFELSRVRDIGSTVDGFHSDVITLQSQNSEAFTNSYIHWVEGKQKVNLCTRFHSRTMFHFENTTISTVFSQCVIPK